jgi:RNA polymerase sigma-19 factor, ECF subfamily
VFVSAAESAIQEQVHALYSHHHGWLYGWLRRKLGDAHQAADLAHDTFVRLLSRREALALDDALVGGAAPIGHRRPAGSTAWPAPCTS